MPPKTKITRQMILDATLEVVREEGIRALNVRAVAARLHCSTQPIMYHFATMNDLKDEIYTIVDENHTAYIMNVDFNGSMNPCLSIGRNYIRFAVENPNLFRFLFQTDRFANSQLVNILEDDKLSPVFASVAERVGLTSEVSRKAFASTFYAIHGIASLMANNSVTYDEAYYEKLLDGIFCGVVGYLKVGPEQSLYPQGTTRPEDAMLWEAPKQ